MNKITMNIKELVRATANKADRTQKEVDYILECLDAVVKEQLGVVDRENSVEIKILPSGLSVLGDYAEPHQAKNPATGETVEVPAKVRVKAKVFSGLKKAANA